MKILSALALVAIFAACNGAGDRTVDMETVTHEQPSSDPNPNNNAGRDTSASHVQDSTTVMDYDTAVRKR